MSGAVRIRLGGVEFKATPELLMSSPDVIDHQIMSFASSMTPKIPPCSVL